MSEDKVSYEVLWPSSGKAERPVRMAVCVGGTNDGLLIKPARDIDVLSMIKKMEVTPLKMVKVNDRDSYETEIYRRVELKGQYDRHVLYLGPDVTVDEAIGRLLVRYSEKEGK